MVTTMTKKLVIRTVLMLFLLQNSTSFASTMVDIETINFYAEYTLPKKDNSGNILASACAFDKSSSKYLALAAISAYKHSKLINTSEIFNNKYTSNTNSMVVSQTMKSEVVRQSEIINSNGLESTCTLVKVIN